MGLRDFLGWSFGRSDVRAFGIVDRGEAQDIGGTGREMRGFNTKGTKGSHRYTKGRLNRD